MKHMAIALTALAVAWSGLSSAQEVKRADRPHPAPGMIERPVLGPAEQPKVREGTALRRYQLAWTPRSSNEIVDRLTAAASLLLDEPSARQLREDKRAAQSLRGVAAKEQENSWVRIDGMPLMVKYDSRYDEFRLLNRERESLSDGPDIGIDKIKGVAEKTLVRLGEQGLVDPRLYATASMHVGYELVGSGSVAKNVGPARVSAYRITYRPRLDGFELANAGVRMGILPSGELQSLRVGGVRPKGEWQNGQLKPVGRDAAARTDASALMRRFHQELPKGVEPQVAWSRIMYVMPDEERDATVSPMLVISWTAQRAQDGTRVASRRQTLAYSLVDPKAPPVNFDPPADKHETPDASRRMPDR